MTGPSTNTVSRREGLFSECLNHMILPSLTVQCYLAAFAILSSHCRQIIHHIFLHQLALARVKFAYGKKCLMSLDCGVIFSKY